VLRKGISEFRLPKRILERFMDILVDCGVNILEDKRGKRAAFSSVFPLMFFARRLPMKRKRIIAWMPSIILRAGNRLLSLRTKASPIRPFRIAAPSFA
jgi:hypothetical protein